MNTAVILAAGIGGRLEKTIGNIPKGFIEIDSQAIVMRSIINLKSVGVSKIIIGTGYHSEYYEAFEGKNSVYCIRNNSYANTGSFYTLYKLRKHLHDDFLLLESDLLYEKRALTILMNHHKKDIILASGKTNLSDEVFIEVDKSNHLHSLSKNQNMLSNIYGELVGISKISIGTYGLLCNWAENNVNQRKIIHYEEALVKISNKVNIFVEKIDDLVWTEIDTKEHFIKACNFLYPELLKKEDA